MNRYLIGKQAEELALVYLHEKNYKLIRKNFYIQGGELDLIMRNGQELVFVEVKCINKYSTFSVYELLTSKKKRKLKRCIETWINVNNQHQSTWSFELICIKGSIIEHFKNIPLE